MLAYIKRGDGFVAAPRHVRLSYDSTCNLFCPSCRQEKIALKGAAFNEAMRITNEIALPVLRRAHTVMMNGYGDIFSSRVCRHLLRIIRPAEYPNLKFAFITNGVLLTEEEWNKFPNIHGMVRSIRVSIDAATKPVYDAVRLGGDFAKLSRNLEFIAGLRRRGIIAEFTISMVVQRDNFREMVDFWQWGKRLSCDFVIYERLGDWLVSKHRAYKDRAVHLPEHPLNGEYRAAVATLFAAGGSGASAISGDLRKVV